MNKNTWAKILAANVAVVALLLLLLWPAVQPVATAPPTTLILSPPPTHTPEAQKEGAAPTGPLASTLDPICDMSVDPSTASATSVHDGKTYGFCSSYCKGEFEKDPAKYIAKLAEVVKKNAASALTTQP